MTEHKTGRIGTFDCPSRKRVYEREVYALNALRHMREHGEIRAGQGHVYPCRTKGIPLHYHVTSAKRRSKTR